MKVGLTLGKFAPLHRGHQLVIETALTECERVIVIIYDAPETTRCPLPVRAAWIRQLYPQVEVLLAWDGPAAVGHAPEITSLHDAYLQAFLAGRTVTHFYSSEFYGEHVSRALGAIDRRVDEARARVPVSGTAIRQDPFQFRDYLARLVYADLITKAVFLGAPSTGKTTLAQQLAARHQTVWMPEYGREYWETHQVARRLTLEQLVEIAEGHRQREDALVQQANRYLFVDTDASTTWQFSIDYHGEAHPRLGELAAETRERYDLFFLCGAEIPYDDTPDRSGEVHREVFQRRIEADLLARRIPLIRLTGTLPRRIARVEAALSAYVKFDSLPDRLL